MSEVYESRKRTILSFCHDNKNNIQLSHILYQSLDTDIIFHNFAVKNYGPRN